MKIHICRRTDPSKVEIGDVVLWDNDVPVEIESITRTKDGYELSGHNRTKPGMRAITIRPRGELLLSVLPNAAQAARLAQQIEHAVNDAPVDEHPWSVDIVNDLKPIVVRTKTTATGPSPIKSDIFAAATEPVE